jgi:hypothetical protein
VRASNPSHVHLYVDKGYFEIRSCSSTGLGMCRLELIDPVSTKRLVVITGGAPLEDMKVINFFFEKDS